MSYRTILLELRDEPASEARTRAAFALARRLEAELVAIHAAALAAMPVSIGDGTGYVDPGMLEAQREANRMVQARVRETFERLREPGVPSRLLLVEDVYGTAISDAARTVDLTILGPAHVEGLERPPSQAVDSVLVEAGGPVLVLPHGETGRLPPARALVAWNGSRQAARAAKDALPLLALADEVAVLTLGEDEGGSLEAAAAMLARHGVRARAELRPEKGGTADRLLEHAAGEGADLLVMGAYSHSRLREAVFGGTTREVLDRARLPVLLSA